MSASIRMAAVALALATWTIAPSASQTSGEKIVINALAVNMSNVGSGAAPIEFTVERWSTAEERQHLIDTMVEQGADALLRALRQMPSHGRMRIPSWQGPDPLNLQLGWALRYAWETSLPEGGRRIVLAVDRQISFTEAVNRPRSIDYPFTVIEVRVDKEGEGEGKMSVATKINFDKANNVIELENYASEPVRLQSVRVKPMR